MWVARAVALNPFPYSQERALTMQAARLIDAAHAELRAQVKRRMRPAQRMMQGIAYINLRGCTLYEDTGGHLRLVNMATGEIGLSGRARGIYGQMPTKGVMAERVAALEQRVLTLETDALLREVSSGNVPSTVALLSPVPGSA